MRRVLLLYISNNSGHHRAMLAVEEALKRAIPGVKIMTINSFNYTNPILEKVINRIYNRVIKVKPEVWEYLYDNPEIARRAKKLRVAIHKFNSRKLKNLIRRFNPDAVVCSQAFPCGMIADIKKTKNWNIPLVGVLTDYAPHVYWMYDNVDAYVVPSEQTRRRFIECGIKKSRVFPFGIPISLQFAKKENRRELLHELHLDDHLPTILIMGGGQGLGPIEELIFALNTLDAQFQLIVVCGINKKLKKWLEKRKVLFRKKMAILGYTRDVPRLMTAADLIVSKPGGLTTAEALTKGLPIVIVNPIPGQEAMNTKFLTNEGVAVKAVDTLDAARLIQELLAQPERLSAMKAAALKHAHPQSAVKVAELVLNLIKQRRG